MKREDVFEAVGGIDERYIAESARYAPGEAAGSPERIVPMNRKRLFTIALAAALVLALCAGAYAAYSSMSHRVPDAAETFSIHYEGSPTGYIEWKDAKLAVTFPETAVSREIEFRPGWLPFELPDTLYLSEPYSGLTKGTWFKRFTAESLDAPGYPDMSQPLLIESYSMSQFNDGGAILLLYYTPDGITEEHWDAQGVDVMRFHCTMHLDAVPEYNMPERTLEQNILLMSNAEAGWVIRLAGEIGMDQLVKVAKSLEVRETGKTFTAGDFEDKYLFFDGGVG